MISIKYYQVLINYIFIVYLFDAIKLYDFFYNFGQI